MDKDTLRNLVKWLDAIFPPFRETERVKPKNMLYVAHENPTMGTAFAVGAQHAVVLLMLAIYAVIAGQELEFTEGQLRGFVSVVIVAAGIATFLQSTKTRFGSGHLIVHNPSPIGMAGFIAVSSTYGIGAATGALIVSGIVVIALARVLPSLRSIFPAEVAGVLLVLLGLSLVEGGVSRYTGLNGGSINSASTIIASVTLVSIIGLSIWAGGRLKLFAIVIGAIAGLITAALMGEFGHEQMAVVSQQPLVSFPFGGGFEIPMPKFILGAIIPILLIEVISAIDSIGTGVAIDKINNAKWHRADMPMIGRTVTCHGIGVFFAGLMGTMSIGTSSANLGLAHASGVAARKVGLVTGAILVVVAFLPQVSTFLTQIPQPVVGAIVLYTAGYMLVAGMELVLSRMINSRRTFMIGLGIAVGAAVLLMPALTAGAPEGLKPIVGSALTMGTVTAIILNLIFRIGISQTGTMQLTGVESLTQLTEFLEEKGEDWGARHQVMMRAGMAVGEAIEKLNGTAVCTWPVDLKASFDEYKVTVELKYEGHPINMTPKTKVSLEDLMDDDDDEALDALVSNASGILIGQLADKVESKADGKHSTLRLDFDH
ncbi:purine/pyrimidine permease [Verrucomicrobiaceae bacterium N1E253]|uniref:Purine/pyrimidine permease n=1 Tax=Oceaniferula marina TaxID=2748318 RepID=A0A851GIL6_9BACT|nr:solute carrier family 23 protein [Oceaniferula marina]NWK56782.1 purine/pyrimidine permease [Oceaniferula marina]